jgi:uncharacterized protein DUF6265
MRHHIPTLAFILIGAFRVSASAQPMPDFSGTWTAEPSNSTPAVYGSEVILWDRGDTLVLVRSIENTRAVLTYPLTGARTAARMPGRVCRPDVEALWTAQREHGDITLTMVGIVSRGAPTTDASVTATLHLEADVLTVALSDAKSAAAGRPSVTRYRRTADAPATPPSARPARATLADIAWLAGVWKGTRGPSAIEERWTPAAGGSMIGVSRTVRNDTLSAFEFLCIVERDGGLVYSAMPNARMPQTDFVLTRIDGDSVTFENPEHDFPTAIRYARRGDGTLEAVVSGRAGSQPQTFVFRKE